MTMVFCFFLLLFLDAHHKRIHDAFAHVQLSDIRVIATLGVGGFGRVELVQISNDTTRSFGLKQMKKNQVPPQTTTIFVFLVFFFWLPLIVVVVNWFFFFFLTYPDDRSFLFLSSPARHRFRRRAGEKKAVVLSIRMFQFRI